MKAKIIFSSVVIAFALLGISASPSFKGEGTNTPTPLGAADVQCGVSNSQIDSYLRGAPHYHTYVANIQDVPGTCNSTATIENCGTATIIVQDGIITAHQDQNGICDP